MTLVDDPNSDYDGLYTLERNFAAEASTDFEFKVVQDHAWGVAYPASNATGNIPNAGTYKVVISYDPTSHAVEFHATAMLLRTARSISSNHHSCNKNKI